MKVNRTDFNNSLLDYGFKDYQIKAIQERMDKYIYPQIEAIPLGAEVIKLETFKRINEKQQTHFWDSGENRKVCKNCYWFCKGDEGRFCMTNLNVYLHKLFNNWDSQKCGCTSFEKGKHFFYG